MCRLCALTNTELHIAKAQILDRCTLMGMGDSPAQRDGWGVSNGTKIHKARGPYRSYNQTTWMENFGNHVADATWISHVRQASTGTALSDDEAHPFDFKYFVAAHNGTIYGTYTDLKEDETKDQPSSDSWRAFYRLNAFMEAGRTIDSCLEEWLNRYDDTSAFVFFVVTRDMKLHVIRGPDTRDMFYAPFANGFIFNTDKQVILAAQEHFRYLTGREHNGEKDIQEFPKFTYAIVSPGQSEFEFQRTFKWEPKRAYTQSHWDNSGTYTARMSAAKRQATGGRWIKVQNIVVELDAKDQPMLDAWIRLRQALYPMRDSLALEYAAMMLRESVRNFNPTQLTYDCFTLGELEDLAVVLKESRWALSDAHRALILQWNKNVPEEDESTMLFYLGMGEANVPCWKFDNVEEWLKSVKGVEANS